MEIPLFFIQIVLMEQVNKEESKRDLKTIMVNMVIKER